jgi:hypothetical protein
MSDKLYIRIKADGFIYDYNERMAVHPECEVVSEAEAYPERGITPKIADTIKVKRSRKEVNGLDLSTDIPVEPVYTDPELAVEAKRGWPE